MPRGAAVSAPSVQLPALAGVIRWGDLPVPYVAAWSSETTMRVGKDSLIGNRPALFRGGGRGKGKPIFGQMDEARTRVVVVNRLCQVCARPLRGVGYVADVPYGSVNGAPLVHEPPACRPCFQTALALCPGIARMAALPRMLFARVRRYDAILVTLAPAEGGDEELNRVLTAWRGEPVVGYARPALADYDVLSLAQSQRQETEATP